MSVTLTEDQIERVMLYLNRAKQYTFGSRHNLERDLQKIAAMLGHDLEEDEKFYRNDMVIGWNEIYNSDE
jgi:hypothetical protein